MGHADGELAVSLTIKAARWLAGTRGAKGAAPLSVKDLAGRPELHDNRITENRIEDIEQMRVTPRPLELEAISRALRIDLAQLAEIRGRAATGSASTAPRSPLDAPDELGLSTEAHPTSGPRPGQAQSRREEERQQYAD